jgi:NADH pyrophosphatase NudC (nudix superfamily)
MTNTNNNRLIKGYDKVTRKIHDMLVDNSGFSEDWLKNSLYKVQDEAIALKELSKLEAQQISNWFKRDLRAIASFIGDTRQEIKDWLPVELKAEENYLYRHLISVADKTTVELLALKDQTNFAAFEAWHTGEVAGAGILQCSDCGNKLHFKKTGHIPPCPKCHKSTFARIADDLGGHSKK